MDATKQRTPNDPLVQPISVDADEEFYLRRRRPSSNRHLYRNISVLLVLVVASGYAVSHFAERAQPVPAQHGAAPVLPAASNPVPPIYTADALVAPKPLADCIKPDNIIDEAVATCRFGQFPRAILSDPVQSMVADSPAAKYKIEQQPVRAKRVLAQNIETHTIWQWDGKRTYAAEWAVTDNRIESNSVCANYRRGSIEYRECRKGALVYFREKCREWGKRWSMDQAQSSKAIEQRFCSAADAFNPLG